MTLNVLVSFTVAFGSRGASTLDALLACSGMGVGSRGTARGSWVGAGSVSDLLAVLAGGTAAAVGFASAGKLSGFVFGNWSRARVGSGAATTRAGSSLGAVSSCEI